MKYICHLEHDDAHERTLCGQPWQGWQKQTAEALPPYDTPFRMESMKTIYFCESCRKLAREGYHPR